MAGIVPFLDTCGSNGKNCNFSNNNFIPALTVILPRFSRIIACFFEETQRKWVQTPQTKVKITPMELHACYRAF